MKHWLSQLKGIDDTSIPHLVGKKAKKIVIHHDADGDDDGTYEKFEINVNGGDVDVKGGDKSETKKSGNDSATGVENIWARNYFDRFDSKKSSITV